MATSRCESRGRAGPVDRLASAAIQWLVVLYRASLGAVLGGHCRHVPSCSQYLLDAVEKYGPWRGAWRGIKRIARCHPLGTHGHDPA